MSQLIPKEISGSSRETGIRPPGGADGRREPQVTPVGWPAYPGRKPGEVRVTYLIEPRKIISMG